MMQRDLVTAALVAVWYLASLAFNLGMKRSHALVPDVMLHTSMQLAAGAAVAGAGAATCIEEDQILEILPAAIFSDYRNFC